MLTVVFFSVHFFVVHLHLLLAVFVVLFVLLFIHIFCLLLVLKELLIVVLLIHGLHVLRARNRTLTWSVSVRHLAHSLEALSLHLHHHSRSLAVHLHHCSFLLEAVGPKTLVPRCAKWPNLFLATKFWRSDLTIVIVGEVAVRSLTSQHALASLPLAKVADCALVTFSVVRRKSLGARSLWTQAPKRPSCTDCSNSLQSCIICTNTVQKVGVPTVSVAVLCDHLLQLLLLLEIVFPFAVVVI